MKCNIIVKVYRRRLTNRHYIKVYKLFLECGGTHPGGGTHPEGTRDDTCHLVSTIPPECVITY